MLLLHRQLSRADDDARPRRQDVGRAKSQVQGRRFAAAEHARCRARLSRSRPRPSQGGLLSPVRRSRSRRAYLDPRHRHQHGPARTSCLLQGKGGQGHRGQRRSFHLSRPDGGRHSDRAFEHRSRRQGSGAASRNDGRHRGQVQSRVRQGRLPDSEVSTRQGIEGPRHRWPKDEQVVRQHH